MARGSDSENRSQVDRAQMVAESRISRHQDLAVSVALKVLEVFLTDYLSKPTKPGLKFWLENIAPDVKEVTKGVVPLIRDLAD